MVVSSLFVYLKIGNNMENQKQHGGRRSNAGRPANDRSFMVGVRITKEAYDKLQTVNNKSEFIDKLIKETL